MQPLWAGLGTALAATRFVIPIIAVLVVEKERTVAPLTSFCAHPCTTM